MIKRAKFPWSFRVYPDNGFLYFTVTIFRSVKQMHAQDNVSVNKNYCAICLGGYKIRLKRNLRVCVTGSMGQIWIPESRYRIGIITHECAHAAFRYLDRRFKQWKLTPKTRFSKNGRGNCSDRDEVYCWVLGNLVRQIVLNYNDHRSGRKTKRYFGNPWFGKVVRRQVSDLPPNRDEIEAFKRPPVKLKEAA